MGLNTASSRASHHHHNYHNVLHCCCMLLLLWELKHQQQQFILYVYCWFSHICRSWAFVPKRPKKREPRLFGLGLWLCSLLSTNFQVSRSPVSRLQVSRSPVSRLSSLVSNRLKFIRTFVPNQKPNPHTTHTHTHTGPTHPHHRLLEAEVFHYCCLSIVVTSLNYCSSDTVVFQNHRTTPLPLLVFEVC